MIFEQLNRQILSICTSVSRAMGCLFGCFRIKDDRSRIPHSTIPTYTVSFFFFFLNLELYRNKRIWLMSICLFLSEGSSFEESFVRSIFIRRCVIVFYFRFLFCLHFIVVSWNLLMRALKRKKIHGIRDISVLDLPI